MTKTSEHSHTRSAADVLVIGGGNAALCAAISACRAGAQVTLLEAAPEIFRGGDSRYTRNLRYLHDSATEYLTGPYDQQEFWEDLVRVTEGQLDEQLAQFTIAESKDLGEFIAAQGGGFQPPLGGTLNLARTNAFFFGGGKALVNAYYATAAALGVVIRYDAEVTDLEIQAGRFSRAIVQTPHGTEQISARSVVLASGGFQANLTWLKEYWGDAADNFIIRGTEYNQGRMLRVLLDHGARAVGDPTQCHAIAVDARAPQFDSGIVSRLDCIPFGVVVNQDGERFYDEGEDIWPKRYAIWGRLIAQQPGQIAYSIIDSKVSDSFMPTLYPPFSADTVDGLASLVGLDSTSLLHTIQQFNAAVQSGTYRPAELDNCRTQGLEPPKSHWALPVNTPPYHAWPLKPGITFTYLGLKVNERAEVLLADGGALENVYAAGEIMAGSIMQQGYLAGFGMTIGTVFGRIAGREAANDVAP